MITNRSVKDGPWCWQSKTARRRIREAFDSTNNVATALAVYDALSEIASDDGAEQFTTTHAWIQRISGVGVTTIKGHISVFTDLGLIAVSTPALRAPSTYTLLEVSQPPANVSQPVAGVSQRPVSGPLATSEESKKNPKEHCTDGAGKTKGRKRNELLDVLATLNGADIEQITASAWGAAAKALAEIKGVCPNVTKEEIARRAGHYQQNMPAAKMTPSALAKWWADCDRPSAAIAAKHRERPEPIVRRVDISHG